MWNLFLFSLVTLFAFSQQSFAQETKRTLKSVESELKNLALKYPHLAKLETYGKTEQGHPLYALKISDNPEIDEDEVELMITAATHGDEQITVEVEMDIINILLKQYKKNPFLQAMIDERELFFIPVVSPDSFKVASRNVQAKDPNREYPSPQNPDKQSVDCISALIKWFDSHEIQGSIDLHAGFEMIMYPWSGSLDPLPQDDQKKFEELAKDMAKDKGVTTGQISQILHLAEGSSGDYYYWKKKTMAFGIEISPDKNLSGFERSEVLNMTKEMVWKFIAYF